MFCGAFLEVVPPTRREQFIESVERHLRPTLHRDGRWHADYHRLRVVAYKNAS